MKTFKTAALAGRLLVLALLLAGMLAPATQAQTADDGLRFSERAPATGARMLGLAGASGAGLADPSAMFNNPAGLGYFSKSSFSGSFNTLYVTDDALFEVPGVAASSPFEEEVSTPSLGNLAYIYDAPTRQGSLVFGVSFNQINTFERTLTFNGANSQNAISETFFPRSNGFGLDVEEGDDGQFGTSDDVFFASFDDPFTELLYNTFALDLDFDDVTVDAAGNITLRDDLPFFSPSRTTFQSGTVTEEGNMYELNFGGAVEAVERVMVGGSLNLNFGTYRFTSFYEEEDAGDALFDRLELIDTFESDIVGINLRGGVSSEFSAGLRGGLTLETPTFYTITETFSSELFARSDDGFSDTYGDDFDEDAADGEFEYEMRSPWRIGAGVSYQVADATILADIELIDWSQMEFDASTDQVFFERLNQQIRRDYQTVVNTRMGLEYRVNQIILRGGFAFNPDPRETVEARRTDGTELDRSKLYFSAGLGFRFTDEFQIDLGWMQERFEDQYLPYSGVDRAPVIDEDIVRNRFAVGLQFLF